MEEDQGKSEEEKFDFTREGETLGYISLDQARVLAMRTVSETPGAYGRAHRDVPMAFEVVETEETEDYYVITITFRPQGDFTGTPGREQFFIEKEGVIALRQVMTAPSPRRRLPVVPTAVGLAAAAVIGVIAVFTVGGFDGGGGGGEALTAAAIPLATTTSALAIVPTVEATATSTPSRSTPDPTVTAPAAPTATQSPSPTPIIQVVEKEVVATATPTPAPTPLPTPTATIEVVIKEVLVTATPAPTPIPTPSPTPVTAVASSRLTPHVFVGTARINDAAAPQGTIITAWVGGTEAASTTTTGGGGDYLLVVAQGNQSFAGETITFLVGGSSAAQTATWAQGGGSELTLSATREAVITDRLPPHWFVGTAWIDDVAAPERTTVTAWVGGTEVASATTTGDGGDYLLMVDQGDQSFSGETISFLIGAYSAAQTALWMQGGGDGLTLSATSGAAAGGLITIALHDLNDSGRSGTATLTAIGNTTEVVLALSVGTSQTRLVHIHSGQCGNSLGGVAFSLTSFIDGSRASITTVAASLASLRDSDHAINTHDASNPSIYTACGNIP